ncbi:hypothetical protein [Paracoccus aminovorans]|uniref:hypothetical protein n=1 Tax=Paracoccus aminovorans TaxID=34004 RepID=UPI002B25998A|nr:hypothetical protein [Paracoccus aminovorans]
MIIAFRRLRLLPLRLPLQSCSRQFPSGAFGISVFNGTGYCTCRMSMKIKRQRFKRHPIGLFHIGITEMQTSRESLFLCRD